MSGSVNKVILIGNLGADPEVRSLSDGSPVVNLSLATNRRWTDQASGERRERTEWHRIVIFDQRLAEVAQNYLRKGSKVYLEGELQTRKWTDAEGAERYTTEVVLSRFRSQLTMLDSRAESEALAAGGQTTSTAQTGTKATKRGLNISTSAKSIPTKIGPKRYGTCRDHSDASSNPVESNG